MPKCPADTARNARRSDAASDQARPFNPDGTKWLTLAQPFVPFIEFLLNLVCPLDPVQGGEAMGMVGNAGVPRSVVQALVFHSLPHRPRQPVGPMAGGDAGGDVQRLEIDDRDAVARGDVGAGAVGLHQDTGRAGAEVDAFEFLAGG